MSNLRGCLIVFIVSGIALAALVGYVCQPGQRLIIAQNGYWGEKNIAKAGPFPKDNENVEKFEVVFDSELVANLREELARTKWVEPLEGAAYQYGVNLNTFKQVISYWQTKFDFASAQNRINELPHYRTEVEGLNIHFFRSAPKSSRNVKVIPLLMIHGWPGSFVEFLKVAPRLSRADADVAFDIIVPSLPGYGYSDAPKKSGVDVIATARIFNKLMTRLGYKKYYVQGGDWGAVVATALGIFFPDSLRGLHLNMAYFDGTSLKSVLKQLLFSWFPEKLGDGQLPPCMMIPTASRFVDLLRESGYMHIQATKPDTVGFALLNSPAGLAAYITEKFSTWTQDDFRFRDDGGHGKKFSLDDILTNVMVYYSSGSIISSQRYYRENFATGVTLKMAKSPVNVPMGYAVFPNEISCIPKFLLADTFKNITTMTYQKDGGHFAAFEQPALLEKDIRLFVNKVEELYPEKLEPAKGFAALR